MCEMYDRYFLLNIFSRQSFHTASRCNYVTTSRILRRERNGTGSNGIPERTAEDAQHETSLHLKRDITVIMYPLFINIVVAALH